MELVAVAEVLKLMNQTNVKLTEADKEFVVQFAFRTEEIEFTKKLIDELNVPDGDNKEVSKTIYDKYETMSSQRPDWIKKIENLLVTLEMYRVQEEIAIKSLSEILKAYDISITEEELMTTDIREIKTKLKKEASL